MRVIRFVTKPIRIDFPLWLCVVWTGYAAFWLIDLVARMVP